MTETSYRYGIIPSLPVASPPTYLLLIDSRVSNYQDIINAKQPGVYHIVFDAPTRPTRSTKLIKDVEEKIAALGVGAFTSIGLVQHNDEKPVYEMFGRTSDIIKPRISAVERDDPDFQSWNSVALFITMLRNNYGIEYFDMMACALYSNPDWKYIIDKLTTLTGVSVRASTDDTGAASLGGDWFLESHTGVNLKDIYFTDAIESYNGLLYTAPPPPSTASTKKLILIDHRIKDIDVIINAMNDDTYCLVFNYFYDTPESILSKLRFLNTDNRYILDHFHYETPEIPTQIDASGNQCTPCDDFDIADIQLLPGTLQNEYLEYTTSAAAAANDASGNGGVWPFYRESTNITINKPVFFQRSKIGETTESVVYPSTEVSTVILNYKQRPMVLVSDLDEFYLLGQDVGEIVGDALAFECVGIIQHTVDPYIGYKFIGGGDDSVSPAIIQDVASRDAGLSSWAAFSGFIQSLKTAHQTTTLDMMACALYANPDWKYIIDTLAVRENITIRASLDNTGSSANDDDANWVLETDNVSLTTVYFTDKIYAWKYVLATYIDTRFNALRWNNPIETNNSTGMFASRAYDARLKIAAGTNNFTIEAWYYEPATRLACTIVDMGNYNYLFQIRTVFAVNGPSFGGLNFYNNSIAWNHSPSSTITPGQWNHVAITRSGSTFTFYVNGIARQTFTNSASLQSNDSTFAIGMQSPDNCSCNKMKLDTVLYDIRLWNVARTANEIRMFRNRVVPANSTGLVANYLCTDNGSTFNDRTSNALHTTIQSYDASRWSNTTVPIPNVGFLISNSYSLRTSNTGSALNTLTHFDDITYTDFSGVDLSGVNFRGANLTGCNFTNANLTNTDFTNATVLNITTTNATTTGSNLSEAITNMSAECVLNLDGVDDAVDVGIPTWTYSTQFRTTMTVECWFKTADTNNQKAGGILVSRNQTGGNSGASQFVVYMTSSGTIGFGLTNTANTGSYHTTTLTYKDALWHHVAVTYNSSTGLKRIFIDGALSMRDVVTGFGLLSNNTTQKLVFGSDDGGVVNGYADRQFRGSISDVRIWNVERSSSEIADNYQRRLAGNDTGLVGYWKLNQGRGSGWGSYSAVMDSTTSRAFGSIFGAGATPSGSWVVSNLKFQPRVSALTLGTNNGVYNFSDSSFSFIDPSSNSLGNFSYLVSPSSVATIANGASTMKTIYSLSAANLAPTYTLYEFPVLADLPSWQIDISFTVTGYAGTWRALIGDMYNNVNTGRGWGLWVSQSNGIHWSWIGTTAEPATISVSLGIPYVLTAAQSAGTITLTLRTVSTGATQTGSFSVGANAIGRGPVSIGGWQNYAGENFPGTISYVNVGVPTNQRLVTISASTDAGTPATVTAIQDSSFDFGAGSQTASLTVNKVAPTIGTLSIPAKNFGDASFNLTAPSSNSGGAFTYTSSNEAVATVTTSGTVTIVGGGSTTITATQAATSNYNSGSVTASLVVSPIAPTIGALSAPAKNFGDASFNLTAPSSNSGGAFTYTSSNEAVATVTTSGTVTIVGGGSTTITATQAATSNYNSGSVTASLVVSPIAPTIGALSAPAKNFGDASFNLTAPSSNSGGAFTYTSSNEAVATVTTSGTVTIVGGGSTTITATQAATSNYNSGSVTASLVVSPIAPTIGALSAPAKNFGDASFNLTAPSSNSGGAFTYTSSNEAVATVTTSGTVTIVGGGSTTITATQAATSNYNSGSVTASLVVSPIAPTIGALSAPAKNFGDASFNLTAPSSNSGGAFTYTSSNEAVATVTTSGTVTIVGGGSTTITATQAATSNYNSGSVTASLVVSPIAPTIGALSAPAKNFGDASFNLTAPSSNSGGAFTYTSSNEAVATVTTSGTVTIVGGGSTTITATQAATSNYNSGSVTASLVVSPIAPTIGALSVPAKNFGDASFNLTAPSSNSGGAFTYTSSNEAVATVTTSGTVTIVGGGSTTITATQAATSNYNSGSVTASLVVSPIAPTIGALSAPAKNFGDASFNLTAPSSNSGGAFTYTSSNEAVATVTTSGTVTIVGGGSTTITATQAATSNYNSGSVTASLVVSPIAPTIGALSAPAKNFGDASFNLTAPSSNSGGAFTYTSSNEAVATVTTSGTVTIVGGGSTTITATQAATSNYNSGSVTASLVVSPIAPTIGALSVPAKNFGDASFNLTAPSSNSGGAFTYTSSNEAVATVTTSGTVTIVGGGSTTITATQAATSNYNSGSVTASLVVSPIAPTIGALSVPAKNFGDASFNLTAPTSNSSGAFTYTNSSNQAVATVSSDGTVTIRGAGSTTITASQAASPDGNYNAGSVTAVLVVSPINPTIGALSVPAKNFRDASFNLTAPTSDSSGVFTYDSSNTAVATVSTGGIVIIVGAGSTTITATQEASADGNYNTGSVTAVLVVSPIAPTIGALSVPAKNFGDASFNLTAPTSDSSGAFTYDSSNTAVAIVTMVDGVGVVTIVGAGTTTITATQAVSADGNYTGGSTVSASLVVSPIAPTIGALSVPAKNFRDISFNLTAPSSNSSGAFTYDSSNTAVATVTSSGVVTIVGAGSTTITASQAASADGNYTGGSSVSGSLVVSAVAPNIGALSVPAKNFGDASFNLTAPTSDSSGAFTYTSSNTAVATVELVDGVGVVTVVGSGSTTITATQAASADGNYTGGSTVSASLVVSAIAPTYQSISQITKTYSTDVSFSLLAVMSGVSNSDGSYSFSTDSNAISIVGGIATILAYTPSAITITASQDASGNYTASTKAFTLLVNRKTPSYGEFSIPSKTFGDASFSVVPYAPTTDSTEVPFTYTSSDQNVATINSSGSVVTIIGQGYTTITASQEASGNYAANSITTSFLVNRAAPTFLKSFTIPNKTFGDASFSLLPFTDGLDNTDGTYHFTSSNAELVSIDGDIATIHAYTPTPITVYVAIDACGNYASSSTSGTLTVIRAAPTIGALSVPATKNFGDASFNISAPSSNSAGAFTYTSSNTAVATVSEHDVGGLATVTVVGAGSTTITATQAINGNYTSGSVTASLVVSPVAPTIGALSVPAKNFRDASFNLTAPTSNSSGAITYTSSNTAVATVTTSGTVTVVSAGSTTITATQAESADGNYTGGSTVSASLVVSPIAPSIGALSVPAKNFRDASFNLTAPTSDSSGAFTYTSSNTAVATVELVGGVGVVTVVGAGTATITATQAASADGNYEGGSSVSASLVISPIAPTIGALSVPAKNFGDASFNLTAPTSDSSGAFTYTSSNTAVATVALVGGVGVVTVVGAGSATITATQAESADGNYTGGSSVTASLVVSPIAPTIGALSISGKNFRDASFNLTAPSSNSAGAFTYTSSNPAVASVTIDGIVTIVSAGTTTITATQAAIVNGNYLTGSVTASLVVSAIAPTIGSLSVPAKNFGDASFNLTAPTSDSSGAFTYTSSNTAVATVALVGGVAVVTVVGAGSSTITATQAESADGNYTGGSTVSASLVVSPIAPTIGSLSVPAKNFRDASFNLTAPTTDSSGAFTYTSSNTAVATVSLVGGVGVVTVVGAGTTTITATQAASADGNYEGGSSVSASLVVSPIAPTIGALSIPAKNFGDASFNLTAPTSDSSGAFTYTSSNTAVATVALVGGVGVVTVVGAGSATITATQAASADGNYTGGSSVTASLVVSAIAPTIGALSISGKNFGVSPFNLTAPTSNSSGAFTYTSSNTAVATVALDGGVGVVTVVGAGTATITATQAASADGNYTGGSSVSASLVVSPIAPTIGALAMSDKNVNDPSFNLTTPTSNSNGAFTYTSSNGAVATVSNVGGVGTVTLVGVGSTTITATQAASADGNYTGGSSVTAILTVTAELSNFTVPSDKKYGDASFNLTDPTSIYSGEPFTFSSSDPTVASIGGADGRTVTIHLAGSTIITATQAATGAHGEVSISATLIVSKKTPVITVAASSIAKNYGDAAFNIALPSSTNTDAVGGGGVFSYSSRNTSIVSIIDTSYVSITGVGSTVVDVTQSATANFTEAVSTISITISKGTPVLSAFTVSTNKTYGSAPFSALAYPSSASAGAFTYSSSDNSVATINSSGIITLLASGYVNFTATQASTALYNSAAKTSNTMTVHRQLLPLIRSSPSSEVINKTYGVDGNFSVIATNASNGGTITYETDNPSVAGIVGLATAGIISVVTVGTATITARRGDTLQYSSVPVSWTVEVGRTTTTLTGLSDVSYNVTAAPFYVSASSASDGAVSYSLQDPTSEVLTIHPTTGLVTLRAPGSAVIVASQAQGTLYLAPTSITATVTVSSAGNALEGATITNTSSFESVNLSGASLAGVTITNTTFESANLNGSNMTNAMITNANFANADLSGVRLTGASITGATFTAVTLNNADLSGAVVTNTVFTGADLSGAILTRVDASGSSFANASLSNVDLTGANITNTNFTNTNIKGANITDVSFSDVQKLQLLKNSENREIPQVIVTEVPGTTVLAVVSESSPLRSVANLNLANSILKVIIPQTSPSPVTLIQNIEIDVTGSTRFYLPINENEYFQIQDIKYYASAGVVRNYTTNAVVEVIYYNGTPIWLFAGSIVGLILQANTLNSAAFVVPRIVTLSTAPFMPTTLPTSNSNAPIVYSSSNLAVATIDASSGLITVVGNQTGEVVFTATQVQNVTHEPGVSVSNRMTVSTVLNFSLIGLNQAFNLSTLATLDASSVNLDATDATAIFYVRLSDMLNVFKYQSDAFDVDNLSAQDIKYYVFHRNWPSELRINPSHAMMNQLDSVNMLGSGFSADKSLTKHDFIRHIALALFNTIHGVDLFSNEEDLMENSVYLGETVRHNIDGILSDISTTSSSEAMAYDASGNKYLTNDASGNTNLCRELMRQVAASSPLRFYNNGGDNAGIKTVPFLENDTIQFKLVMQAAIQQNLLTGVSEIPSRSYTIKLILKNTVNAFSNTNTMIRDSEMYPNSFPYSTSVTTYAPTADSSGVYNIYSPPAPIPFARYGYNGWYYTNSTAWVNIEPAVRNHVKWLVAANTGSSKVGDLQYIRFNLKIHNKTALPYLMIYTDAGSSRKYPVVGGSASLTNGGVYSFYMNFNSYGREPAVIGHTNAALAYTVGSGSFANTEGILNIALETDSNAAAGSVEFTLMSIVVGELSTTTGATTEKEYGFQAAVLDSYP